MRFLLFILFVAMPFIEIALLIKLGNVLGFWPTIAIVITTAIIGSYVLQSQGLATLRRVSQSVSSGEPPIKPVVDGFFLAIAGAFLLTPGVVTDAIGLLLLIPPVRHAIARWAFGRIIKSGSIRVQTYTSGGRPTGAAPGSHSEPRPFPDRHTGPAPRSDKGHGPIIDAEDAEYEDLTKKK